MIEDEGVNGENEHNGMPEPADKKERDRKKRRMVSRNGLVQ